MKLNVISIGYGRHLFLEGDRERLRAKLSAAAVNHYDMIIFSRLGDALVPTVVSETLTLHPTNSKSTVHMFIDAYRIASRLVTERKGQIVVTTQDPFETALIGLVLKWFYKVRLVVQEHGDFFGHAYWRRESWLNRVRYLFGLFVLRRADGVRVVSKRIEQRLAARGITNITAFPVAVDKESYVRATESNIVRELFPRDTFVFLSVARFVPQKNLSLLIEAFATVYQTHTRARLLLVGSGPLEATLRAESLQRFGPDSPITFLPWSPDVPGLMKAADVYVLSSNYEGWGRVLIEAMLSTLPTVTTDVGCAGEVLKHRQHGLIVPVADATTLAKAMEQLVSDRSLYGTITNNLHTLEFSTLPGTDLSLYGEAWAKTLEV